MEFVYRPRVGQLRTKLIDFLPRRVLPAEAAAADGPDWAHRRWPARAAFAARPVSWEVS
jgi:hypothetical protein